MRERKRESQRQSAKDNDDDDVSERASEKGRENERGERKGQRLRQRARFRIAVPYGNKIVPNLDISITCRNQALLRACGIRGRYRASLATKAGLRKISTNLQLGGGGASVCGVEIRTSFLVESRIRVFSSAND